MCIRDSAYTESSHFIILILDKIVKNFKHLVLTVLKIMLAKNHTIYHTPGITVSPYNHTGTKCGS